MIGASRGRQFLKWDHEKSCRSFLGCLGSCGTRGEVPLYVTQPGRNRGWSRDRMKVWKMLPWKGRDDAGVFWERKFRLLSMNIRKYRARDLTNSLQLMLVLYMGWTQTLLWDSLLALRLWDWHGTGVLGGEFESNSIALSQELYEYVKNQTILITRSWPNIGESPEGRCMIILISLIFFHSNSYYSQEIWWYQPCPNPEV